MSNVHLFTYANNNSMLFLFFFILANFWRKTNECVQSHGFEKKVLTKLDFRKSLYTHQYDTQIFPLVDLKKKTDFWMLFM